MKISPLMTPVDKTRSMMDLVEDGFISKKSIKKEHKLLTFISMFRGNIAKLLYTVKTLFKNCIQPGLLYELIW